MSRAVHEFRDPDRFVVGTVGEPGDRVFYVQATSGTRTISVRCEKQQAEILAERMGSLLDEVAAKADPSVPPPAAGVDDLDPLETPVDAEFRVGTMGLGWDAESGQVVVELLAADEEIADESMVLSDSEEGPDALRVYLSPGHARQFVLRGERVVAAGRTACPLCSEPLAGAGHLCVRLNGYRPRAVDEFRALLEG